jgi:hypothetical protein
VEVSAHPLGELGPVPFPIDRMEDHTCTHASKHLGKMDIGQRSTARVSPQIIADEASNAHSPKPERAQGKRLVRIDLPNGRHVPAAAPQHFRMKA